MNKTTRTLSLSLIALAANLLVGVSRAAPVTLSTGGQQVTLNTTDIGGVTYVKLADLRAALAAAGGANAKASVEGCQGEWLFNGVERLRVTQVAPISDSSYGSGWGVTVEIRNGAQETIALYRAGLAYNNAVSLAFADGDSWSRSPRSGWQDKTYTKMQQGTGTLYTFNLFPETRLDASVVARPPQKFLLEVTRDDLDFGQARFTVPDPSFRVDLTCKK